MRTAPEHALDFFGQLRLMGRRWGARLLSTLKNLHTAFPAVDCISGKLCYKL
jgi:hypothetical protein